MPGDDPIPDDETPTQPAAPKVRCFGCRGETTVMELQETASGYRGVSVSCPTCKGTGVVDRHAWAEHHAISQGRPPR